jgi:LPS-assembly protein
MVARATYGSGRFSLAKALKGLCFFISITASLASRAHLAAQQVTTAAPQTEAGATAAAASPKAATQYPDAVPIAANGTVVPVIASQGPQTIANGHYTADDDVAVTYKDHTLQADHLDYNSDTGDLTLTGHVLVTGGENDESIHASHGTFNIHTQTGRFYDVTGSVGLKSAPTPGTTAASRRRVYANGNPFLFTGRMVVKAGPHEYYVYGGTVTSCQLPNPDWLLSASKFTVDMDSGRASATNSIFHVVNLPLLWLPYVTHPVDTSGRQTGILIPEIGFNSASKGDTVGEQVYWAIDRSTDLTVGTIYYSARGWEQTASFRHLGLGQDMATARYSGLQDRGYYPGGVYVNQSGTDLVFSARHDLIRGEDLSGANAQPLPVQERLVADVEYLSSFPYREAFSTNFNQAVSSDVVSTVYATREWNGLAASFEGDRYQGEKRVATTVPLQSEEQVHIFHAPSIEFTTTDHRLGSTGLEWTFDGSATALKRSQPNFVTSGMIERLDLRPGFAYPIRAGQWWVRPSVSGRETFYSRSRYPALPGATGPPVENTAPLNRSAVEVELNVRPPVFERTFDSGLVHNLLHHDVKHTVEPEFSYRYVNGIGNFPDVLRFDAVDVASNTNEVEYGITQRLFLRRSGNQRCRTAGAAADATEILGSAGKEADAVEDPGESVGRDEDGEPVCGNREWISWRLAQKYFFDPNFGGAVVSSGPRDILETTLDFSGISFLTRPRNLSPVLSRLRIRTSEKADIEWDFDYDPCAALPSVGGVTPSSACVNRFTANNIYVDVHQGSLFAGAGYAGLNAPARSYEGGVLSSVADFNQMRVLLGFRRPTQPGLSAAANAGIDINLGTVQYAAIQTTYNWNCCGFSVEYRKYELGTARNDNGYKFNFTLANIGSAGNLRRADQIF